MVRASDAGPDLAAITAMIDDSETFGIDSRERFVRKADRKKLVRKLNGLLVGPSASLYSGGQPFDLDAMRRPDMPGKTPLIVIYLNVLRDSAVWRAPKTWCGSPGGSGRGGPTTDQDK
jgi:hypothetical protein